MKHHLSAWVPNPSHRVPHPGMHKCARGMHVPRRKCARFSADWSLGLWVGSGLSPGLCSAVLRQLTHCPAATGGVSGEDYMTPLVISVSPPTLRPPHQHRGTCQTCQIVRICSQSGTSSVHMHAIGVSDCAQMRDRAMRCTCRPGLVLSRFKCHLGRLCSMILAEKC